MLEKAVRRLALIAAAPLLLCATAHAADAAMPVTIRPPEPRISPVDAPPADAPPVPPKILMSQVVMMTNRQRHAGGCGALAVDHDLIVASVRQSSYMAQTGLFTHVWSDGTTFEARAHEAGYDEPSGENIAWGYPTAAEAMAAWMASPRHRKNILNCAARSIGTGVVYAANGIPYYTEVFGYE